MNPLPQRLAKPAQNALEVTPATAVCVELLAFMSTIASQPTIVTTTAINVIRSPLALVILTIIVSTILLVLLINALALA